MAMAAGAIVGGAIIGGAMSLGGSAISAAAAKKIARKNREFQERMYKSRYQMTMEDMRQAGLNPILAYKQGAGTQPQGSMAAVPDYGQSMAAGASAGTKTGLAVAQRRQIDAQATSAVAAARNQNALAQGAEFDNVKKGVLGGFYGTPPGSASAITRETLGGTMLQGAGGAAAALGTTAKKVVTPTTTPILDRKWETPGRHSPYGDNTRKSGNKWGQPHHYYKRKSK